MKRRFLTTLEGSEVRGGSDSERNCVPTRRWQVAESTFTKLGQASRNGKELMDRRA
jgi:hypothetical protein